MQELWGRANQVVRLVTVTQEITETLNACRSASQTHSKPMWWRTPGMPALWETEAA